MADDTGRYQVAMAATNLNAFVTIVDTQTGRIWVKNAQDVAKNKKVGPGAPVWDY